MPPHCRSVRGERGHEALVVAKAGWRALLAAVALAACDFPTALRVCEEQGRCPTLSDASVDWADSGQAPDGGDSATRVVADSGTADSGSSDSGPADGGPTDGGPTDGGLGDGGGGAHLPLVLAFDSKRYDAEAGANCVAVADVDGDSKLDIITTNYDDDSVSVLLGLGDGGFRFPYWLPAGPKPSGIGVGYVNADPILDVVIANDSPEKQVTGAVSVLLGEDGGTFGAPTAFPISGNSFQRLVLAKLDGDALLDVVVTGAPHSVEVLLGTPDGGFRSNGSYDVGGDTSGVVVGDFNGDGRPDLVVGTDGTDAVVLLIGNGDGTFVVRDQFLSEGEWIGLAAGHFHGPAGPTDLAVTTLGPKSMLTILSGRPDGGFEQPAASVYLDIDVNDLRAEDFDGDGKPDLALVGVPLGAPADESPGQLLILTGNGDGTFTRKLLVTTGGKETESLATADFDGDGKMDLVVTDFGSGTVTVFLNRSQPAP